MSTPDEAVPPPQAPPPQAQAQAAAPASLPPAVLAALGPVLVLGLATAVLGAPPERAEPSKPALELEQRLGAGPEVVVLGNSKVRTDLDLPALRAALGVKGPVADLRVEGSAAPTWYAALENRVAARGLRPRLVIVYGPLEQILETHTNGEADRLRVEAQLDGDDPVIDRKVFGREGGSGLLDRMRTRRTKLHTALLDGLRDRALGWALGTGEAPAPEEGSALAKDALGKIFAEDAFRKGPARARVIPVAEQQSLAGDTGRAGTARVEDTLLPDFADRAKDMGARLLVVRAPVPASNRRADDVDGPTLKAALELLNARGAGWIDLTSALRLPEDAFRDELHMNAVGRGRFMPALAQAIAAMAPLGDQPLAKARAPLVASAVTREGALPALAQPAFSRTDTPCGYLARMTELAGIDDESLVPLGLGTVSPLVVTQDGAPLAPHAGREDFAMRCGGAFLHRARELRLAPSDSAEAPHSFALALSPDFPLRAGAETAWWLYPGTRARWSFGEAWTPDRGDLVVTAEVRVLSGEPPELRVGGSAVVAELLPNPGAGGPPPATPPGPSAAGAPSPSDLRLARATLRVPAEAWTPNWELALEGRGYAVIEKLALGEGADALWLVGEPAPEVRMLAGRRSWEAPEALPVVASGPPEGSPEARSLPAPGWAFLDDAATKAATGVADCSPLRVLADGKALTAPHTEEDAVRRLGGGRYAHLGERLLLPPPNPLAPEGARYTVAFAKERTCEAGSWLHPGDALTGLGVPEDLRRLRRGARALVIGARAFQVSAAPEPRGKKRGKKASPETPPLELELRLKGEPFFQAQLRPEQLEQGALVLPLPARTPPRTTALEVRLRAPGSAEEALRATHWLITRLALTEEAE